MTCALQADLFTDAPNEGDATIQWTLGDAFKHPNENSAAKAVVQGPAAEILALKDGKVLLEGDGIQESNTEPPFPPGFACKHR